MSGLGELLDVLDLETVGEGRFRAGNVVVGGGRVVFGGQLLAQSMVAANTIDPAKEVASIHTIFARGGSLDAPMEFDLDVLQTGRTFASASVTARQGERLCCRSMVLLTTPDPDLVRHEPDMPAVGSPDDATPSESMHGWWETRTVGDVDVRDPAAIGPPTWDVWSRFPDAPTDAATGAALLAFASDGFLIGASLRPHDGYSQALAHSAFSSTVVTHTVRFHEPIDASQWLLLQQVSPYAGRGRIAGRADVFTEDGRFVASYSQESMVRAFPEGTAPAAGTKAAH